jgi:hypothetical protein
MRGDELDRLVREAKRFVATQPEGKALLSLVTDLLSEAGEGRTRAVVAALTAAAQATRSYQSSGMPDPEQQIWERAGAHFDPTAVPLVAATSAAAFAGLVDRSVVGDGAAAELLGVDRSRISQRMSDRSLYAFVGPAEERCFPRWQFVGSKTLPGLKRVLAALDSELHPLSVDRWFTTPNVDLEVGGEPVNPITWLATGGSPKVVAELARDL